MLDNSFKEYLDEEFGRIMPEEQEKYREMFQMLGFGEVNHDFVEFSNGFRGFLKQSNASFKKKSWLG